MSKLERLIYTECRAGIGMSLDGKTPPRTGYGIYSMSEGLLPEGPFGDRVFLENAINLKNATRVASSILINSYAYYVPAGGMPMLGYYFQRDGSDTPNDRLSQAYIDEWLFGDLDCYPMDLFASGYWSAYRKPFTWYIKDAPKPTAALQPVQSSDLPVRSIREEALRFAREGREDLVKKAVLAILQQMSCPLNERKFLVIRDCEENVRLWIAAILYQLPLQAALKVGFNTNGTNLNNTQSNVYAFSTSRKTTIRAAVQNDGGDCERHFYAMIVGVDPRDSNSSYTATPQPNKPWLVIDGVKLKGFEVDSQLLGRDYFKYMLSDDSVITNFFMDMKEMRDVEPNMKLLDLFDAQMLLQNRSQWNYDALVKALTVMLPHFTNSGRAVLLNYVVKYLCTNSEYRTYIERDADNQLKLLRQLRRCAAIANKPNAIEELENVAYAFLRKLMAEPSNVNKLKQYCKDLDSCEKGLPSKLLKSVMDGGLSFVDTVDLMRTPDSYVEWLFRLVDGYISNERTTWGRLWSNPAYSGVLDRLAERVCCSDPLTDAVLQIFSGNRDAVDRLILIGGKSSKQSNRYRWLCKRISHGVTLDHVCMLLSGLHESGEVIEELLCARIEQTGPTEEISDAYNRYLSLNPNVGSRYYTTWYRSLSEQRQNPRYFHMLEELLRNATARSADMKHVVKLLQSMDYSITFEQNEYNRRLVKLILKWSERCRCETEKAELWNFVDAVLDVMNRRLPLYKRCNSENPNCYRFNAPAEFAESTMCRKLMDAALKETESFVVHAIVLLYFQFEDKAAQRVYFDNWAKRVCDLSVKMKNHSLVELYGLYYSCKDNSIRLGRECEQILDNVSMRERESAFNTAMRSVEEYLCQIRTDAAAKDLIEYAANELGSNAAKELEAMLIRTQNSYRSTHKSPVAGFINSISGFFGNKRKGE